MLNGLPLNVYSLKDIFFKFAGYVFSSGKLAWSWDPEDLYALSVVELGSPVIAFKDPDKTVHTFDVEVDVNSDNYAELSDMYEVLIKMIVDRSYTDVTSSLVFDNGTTRLTSTYATITKVSGIEYTEEVPKANFKFRAIRCSRKFTKYEDRVKAEKERFAKRVAELGEI